MIKTIRLFIVALAAVSAPAFADIDYNRQITKIGIQDTGFAYIGFTVAPSGGCDFNVVYVNLSTTYGKELYALVLSSQSKGRVLSRVSYSKSAGICTADLIEN